VAKMVWTGSRFQVSDYSPTEKEKLQQLGFHYDYKAWAYWTGLIHLAKSFAETKGVEVDKKAAERLSQEDNQIALSRAIDSNAIIPVPDGLSYLGFQKAGIIYALPRKDTLIADVMRLGKSVEAIGVINADPSINSILCICPNFLKLNWSREFMKWTVRKFTGSIASPRSANINGKYKTVYTFDDSNIIIINYDIVKKFRPAIDERKWDLVIFDEAHYLKNPGSRRTKACLGADFYGEETAAPIEATRRLYLTGTPILNRPVELWPIVRVADPEGLGTDFWAFCKTFCLPSDAPILMSNLLEKPIAEVKIGEKIIGWKRKNYQRRLCESEVLNVLTKESPLQEVILDDNTLIICTPDHEWLSERRDWREYNIAKVGKTLGRGPNMASRMVRIIDSGMKPRFLHEQDYRLGYLIGFFRGDGWCSQTRRIRENPFRQAITAGIDIHAIGCANNDLEPLLRCDQYLTEFGIDHSQIHLREEDNCSQIDCNHELAYRFFTSAQPNTDSWWAGFLGGIYDAEGSHYYICQDSIYNAVNCKMIKTGLDRFGFTYTQSKEGFALKCERQEWLRFWYLASPSVTRKMRAYLFGVPSRTGFGKETKVVESFKGSGGKFMKRVVRPVSITLLPGIHKVYTLTTSTGNYVAYGIGSKNCNAREASYGWDTSGASNLDELQRRLRAKFMVRRTKEEVLPELPPIRRQIIPIPPEPKDLKVIHAEKEFYDKNMAAFEAAAVQAKIAQAEGSESTYKAAIDEMKAVNKVMFHQMSKLRHDTAITKIPYVIEYLENTLESQEKIVCFAHHRDVIEAIANHFGTRAVKHYGPPMTIAEKQASVDRFHDDPKCNLFVGGLTLAVGYSLAIASLAIFAEISWIPGDMDQAEKRLDAIDQMTSILVQHLLFDDSLDIRMAKKVIEKQANIFNALDRRTE
jgi:hypothetical protein